MEGNENWIAARRVKDHLQPEGSWQDLQRRVRVIESFRFNSHLSLLVTDKFSTTCTAAALRSWVNTITSELLLDHGAQPQVVHMYVCLARSPHDGLVRSADRWAAKSLCKRKRLLMSSSVRNHKQLTVLDHDDVVSTFRHPDYQELFSCTESFPPLLLWPLLLLPLFVFLTCLAVTGASDVAAG